MRKTDAANLDSIRQKIAEFYAEFDKLLARKDGIELCVYNSGVSSVSFTTGNEIEQYISRLDDILAEDIY